MQRRSSQTQSRACETSAGSAFRFDAMEVARTNTLQLNQKRECTVAIFTENISKRSRKNLQLPKSQNAIANVPAATRVNTAARGQPVVIQRGRKRLLNVGRVGSAGSNFLRLRVFLLFLLHPLREHLLELLMGVHALVDQKAVHRIHGSHKPLISARHSQCFFVRHIATSFSCSAIRRPRNLQSTQLSAKISHAHGHFHGIRQQLEFAQLLACLQIFTRGLCPCNLPYSSCTRQY